MPDLRSAATSSRPRADDLPRASRNARAERSAAPCTTTWLSAQTGPRDGRSADAVVVCSRASLDVTTWGVSDPQAAPRRGRVAGQLPGSLTPHSVPVSTWARSERRHTTPPSPGGTGDNLRFRGRPATVHRSRRYAVPTRCARCRYCRVIGTNSTAACPRTNWSSRPLQ